MAAPDTADFRQPTIFRDQWRRKPGWREFFSRSRNGPRHTKEKIREALPDDSQIATRRAVSVTHRPNAPLDGLNRGGFRPALFAVGLAGRSPRGKLSGGPGAPFPGNFFPFPVFTPRFPAFWGRFPRFGALFQTFFSRFNPFISDFLVFFPRFQDFSPCFPRFFYRFPDFFPRFHPFFRHFRLGSPTGPGTDPSGPETRKKGRSH